MRGLSLGMHDEGNGVLFAWPDLLVGVGMPVTSSSRLRLEVC